MQAGLLEDDNDLRGYLTRLLTGDGWVVHAVPDAETALTLIADSPTPAPDVVLTDVMLPAATGCTCSVNSGRPGPPHGFR